MIAKEKTPADYFSDFVSSKSILCNVQLHKPYLSAPYFTYAYLALASLRQFLEFVSSKSSSGSVVFVSDVDDFFKAEPDKIKILYKRSILLPMEILPPFSDELSSIYNHASGSEEDFISFVRSLATETAPEPYIRTLYRVYKSASYKIEALDRGELDESNLDFACAYSFLIKLYTIPKNALIVSHGLYSYLVPALEKFASVINPKKFFVPKKYEKDGVFDKWMELFVKLSDDGIDSSVLYSGLNERRLCDYLSTYYSHLPFTDILKKCQVKKAASLDTAFNDVCSHMSLRFISSETSPDYFIDEKNAIKTFAVTGASFIQLLKQLVEKEFSEK